MNKRTKNKKYVLLLVGLLCLLFVPQYVTKAYFADTASEDTGIELILGSVDLTVKDLNPTQNLMLKDGNSVEIKQKITNTGTLSGKLAYKLNWKDNGSNVQQSVLDSLAVNMTIDDKKVIVQEKVLTDSTGKPLILKPGDSKDLSIEVNAIGLPDSVENLTLEIETLLFQTNGTIDEPLFYDEEIMSYEIKIDNFWNGNITTKIKDYTYAIELPENDTFYYNIRGDFLLNYYHTSEYSGIFYLESKDEITKKVLEKELKTSHFIRTSDLSFDIENSEVKGNRAKIRFRLDRYFLLGLGSVIENSYTETTSFWFDNNEISVTYKAKKKDSLSGRIINFARTSSTKNSLGKFEESSTAIESADSIDDIRNVSQDLLVQEKKTNEKQFDEEFEEKKSDLISQEELEESLPLLDEEDSFSKGSEDTEKGILPEQTEEVSDPNKKIEVNNFPSDEEFKYTDIKLNEDTYTIGITQDQFDNLLRFATLEEFGKQITKETPALYVKYDKVTGIENIERFVYGLAEQKQIDFGITLKDYPEEKILEITFTK